VFLFQPFFLFSGVGPLRALPSSSTPFDANKNLSSGGCWRCTSSVSFFFLSSLPPPWYIIWRLRMSARCYIAAASAVMSSRRASIQPVSPPSLSLSLSLSSRQLPLLPPLPLAYYMTYRRPDRIQTIQSVMEHWKIFRRTWRAVIYVRGLVGSLALRQFISFHQQLTRIQHKLRIWFFFNNQLGPAAPVQVASQELQSASSWSTTGAERKSQEREKEYKNWSQQRSR
jgi:hypothetical protein